MPRSLKDLERYAISASEGDIGTVVTFALQVRSQHVARLGRFRRASSLPLTDCLVLVALGAIPPAVLELLEMGRQPRAQRRTESLGHASAT